MAVLQAQPAVGLVVQRDLPLVACSGVWRNFLFLRHPLMAHPVFQTSANYSSATGLTTRLLLL